MYSILQHIFLETGFPMIIFLGGGLALAFIAFWEELTK